MPLVFLLGCGGAKPPPFTGPRLLDGPFEILESSWDPARIRQEGPSNGLPALLQESFDTAAGSPRLVWNVPAPFTRPDAVDPTLPFPQPPTVTAEAALHGSGGLRFQEANGGALWVVPLQPDTPYDFVVQVRHLLANVPADAGVGQAVLVELADLPRAEGADLFQAVREADQVSVSVLSPAEPADGFQVLRRLFRSSVYSHGLAIFLSAGSPGWWREPGSDASIPVGPVDFEELRLTRLPMARYLAIQDLSQQDDLPVPDPSVLQQGGTAAFLRSIKLLGDVRRTVLAPAGTRLSFPLQLPAGDHRLTLSYGLLEEHPAGVTPKPLRFQVHRERSDGTRETLLDRSLTPTSTAEQGWQDLAATLTATGEATRLLLEVTGPSDAQDMAAFAEPMVQPLQHREPSRRPNVILLSLDTLRSDHLGCYGYQRDEGQAVTPNIDALAERSWLFEQARTVAPYTLPSHATLMTGWWPAMHGVHHAGRRLVRDIHPLLAVQLAEAGYATAAFTGGGFVSHEYGFHLGFDRYSIVDPMLAANDPLRNDFPRPADRPGNDAIHARNDLGAAERWMEDRQDVPFFLFLHTFLVHNYHADPAREAAFVGDDPLGFAQGDRALHPLDLALAQEGAAPPEELLQVLRDLYDASLQEADQHVGRLLEFLERTGLAENTVVILLSDHGEEFGEHGGLLHGRTVYEEVLRIPLLVSLPGQTADRVANPVDLADVAPTILHAVGLEPPGAGQGRPLQLRRAEEDFREELLAEVDAPSLSTRRALVRGNHKVILNPGTAQEEPGYEGRRPPQEEWYDLTTDARELHERRADPLAPPESRARWESLRDRFHALREELEAMHRALVANENALAAPAMSAEQLRLLQGLGYPVGGSKD